MAITGKTICTSSSLWKDRRPVIHAVDFHVLRRALGRRPILACLTLERDFQLSCRLPMTRPLSVGQTVHPRDVHSHFHRCERLCGQLAGEEMRLDTIMRRPTARANSRDAPSWRLQGNSDTWLSRSTGFQGRTPTLVAPSDFTCGGPRQHGDLVERLPGDLRLQPPLHVIEVETRPMVPTESLTGADAAATVNKGRSSHGDQSHHPVPVREFRRRPADGCMGCGDGRGRTAGATTIAVHLWRSQSRQDHLLNRSATKPSRSTPTWSCGSCRQKTLNSSIDSIQRSAPITSNTVPGRRHPAPRRRPVLRGKRTDPRDSSHLQPSLSRVGQAIVISSRSASRKPLVIGGPTAPARFEWGLPPTFGPRRRDPAPPSFERTRIAPDQSRSTCSSTSPAWSRTTCVS